MQVIRRQNRVPQKQAAHRGIAQSADEAQRARPRILRERAKEHTVTTAHRKNELLLAAQVKLPCPSRIPVSRKAMASSTLKAVISGLNTTSRSLNMPLR